MTKEILIKVEFNHREERIKFDASFQAKFIMHVPDRELLVEFKIMPENKDYFTDEEVDAMFAEFDEKVKSYEIIGAYNLE